LNRSEGILLFRVVTEVPLETVSASFAVVARDLPAGDHLIWLTAGSGTYRWSEFTRKIHGVSYYWEMRGENRTFTVEPGSINYAGMLSVWKPDEVYIGGLVDKRHYEAGWRVVNRSAATLLELERRHPALLEQYPMRYAGTMRDDFLEHYFAARRRSARSPAPERAEAGSPE
jgi:hypothetical protein